MPKKKNSNEKNEELLRELQKEFEDIATEKAIEILPTHKLFTYDTSGTTKKEKKEKHKREEREEPYHIRKKIKKLEEQIKAESSSDKFIEGTKDVYDMWSAPNKISNKSKNITRKPDTPYHLVAVQIPKPASSYNPRFEEHQVNNNANKKKALRVAVDKQEEYEEKRRRMEEIPRETPSIIVEDLEEDDEESKPLTERISFKTKKMGIRKTTAKRNRMKLRKLEDMEKEFEKIEKKKMEDVNRIKVLKKEFENTENEKLKRKEEIAKKLQEKYATELPPKKFKGKKL